MAEAQSYLRDEVLRFAVLMEQQLRANDHKPGWKDHHPGHLLERAREEVAEVQEALEDAPLSVDEDRGSRSIRGHRRAVAGECADAANMLMMVADVAGELPSTLLVASENLDDVATRMVEAIQDVCVAQARTWKIELDEARAEVAALKNTVEQLEPEANAAGLVGLANLMGVEWETLSRPELLARCWHEVQRPREEARRVLEGAIAQLDGHHVFGLARELGLDVVGGTALELRKAILDWRPAEEQS